MKIIQSYYLHKENNRIQTISSYLNFYMILLSYLTLKKQYNSVTMYCNNVAYDKLIKFIPYDEIVIKDNNSNIDYKIKTIIDISEPFIYVDTSISIFDNIFDKYINDKNDLLVKKLSDKITLGPGYFVQQNKKFLSDNNICVANYNNKYFETDIVGMNLKFKEKYIEIFYKIFNAMKDNKIKGNYDFGYKELVLDELAIYLTHINNNFTSYQIGNSSKYTQMINNCQLEINYINIIKNKIKKDFSEYYYLIEIYESIYPLL